MTEGAHSTDRSLEVLKKLPEASAVLPMTPAAGKRYAKAYLWIVAALSVIYLIQALSPIRLDNDSVVHLRAGSRLADGLPADFPGSPLGYPAFIAILDRLGLGSYPVFVLANCAFVALGVLSALYLVRDRIEPGRQSLIVPISLLAFPLIRYMPMPLPEIMFMAVALMAVVAMNEAATRQGLGARVALVFIALLLTTIAITLRMMGFVLVPALLVACFAAFKPTKSLRAKPSAPQIAFALVTLVVIAFVAFRLADSFQRYAAETALKYVNVQPLYAVRSRALSTFWSVGALFLNLPTSRFWRYQTEFIGVGFIAIIVALSVFRLRWPKTPAAVYLASSIVLLVLWPYNSVRLWLPIMPLLIAYIAIAPLRFTPGTKWRVFTRVYLAWFVFAGLLSLAYTTRITFSGRNFPKVYGIAGGMSGPDAKTGKVDSLHNARARVLMKRYGRRF